MSDSVQMPALGESVTEGTVTRWLKNEGDRVEVDEPLLEVSTDKVDTEVPSPYAGVLEKILVQEDETVEVGTDLAIIGSGEGGGDTAPAEQEQPAEEAQAEPVQEEQPAEQEQAPSEQEVAQQAQQQAGSGSSSSGEGQTVQMPALGESVTEGTVTRWLKSEGEQVEVDEPLLEVSTDKVDTEVPSPYSGVLTKILVQEDETVEVGADLAVIGGEGGGGQAAPSAAEEQPAGEQEQAKEAEQPSEQRAEQHHGAATSTVPAEEVAGEPQVPAEVEPAATQETPAAPAEAPARPRAAEAAATSYVTPIVRKLAKEKGVDLESIEGTGVGGRIRKEDVLAAAEAAEKAAAAEAAEKAAAAQAAPAAAPAAAPRTPTIPEVSPLRGTREKMSRLRKVIAKRMVESLDTSAQLTTVVEVDVTRIAKLRARAKDSFQAREGVKLTYLPFFVKAATEALKAHPKLNATIDGDEVVYHAQENIGIAVDTERGLMVPVIKDAGDLTIAGIAKRVADLASRTRENKVKPDDLAGSTFTITNLGSNGALFDTPIINQPEVAILGLGAIVKRPVVVTDADGNETIGIRSMVYLPLTYDHRLVDGADAGRFMQTVKKRLEEGAFEAELGL
ncbi:MAG TPA: 2-oxoglutarate dehydrogenase, E2 component, dihydrolipoamide succinyltransferase [Actinomycetaceae bacterium]|nr:2-oxoglutarate dehydrogenase, E2 component, dihydrolipoamide succinyltransferase [Actinomycetaceae bacterium]